jgi:Rod binding domain-containing protein
MAAATPPLSGLPASATSSLSIAELRSAAARDPKAAIRETAKQFEALFMQQLMKSMREATLSSGMLDNEGTKLGNEMLDSQYAAKMTGLPGGLTDAIARQLERQMGDGRSGGSGRRRERRARCGGRPARRCRRSRSTSCSSTPAPRAPPRRRAASRPRS